MYYTHSKDANKATILLLMIHFHVSCLCESRLFPLYHHLCLHPAASRSEGMHGETAVSSDTITSSQGSLLQPESYDCDSEELEALEDEADLEEVDDAELDQEIQRASLLYPTERVSALLEELKQDGLVQFLQNHVVGKTEAEMKALFIALGVLLPKTLRVNQVAPNFLIPILKTVLIRHLRNRRKLEQYSTIEDAVDLIGKAKKIIVLSGR